MSKLENLTPITVDEFSQRLNDKVHQLSYYFSLYILPSGQILDCGYPANLGHNNTSELIYENLSKLPQKNFNSCLKGLEFDFKDTAYHIEDYYKLLPIYTENIKMFWQIDKVLLGTEDRICQDMGFVKVSINQKLFFSQMTVPCSIFEKNVTGAQMDTLTKLSEIFNMDLIKQAKNKQKENAKLAAEIQFTLNKINSKTF